MRVLVNITCAVLSAFSLSSCEELPHKEPPAQAQGLEIFLPTAPDPSFEELLLELAKLHPNSEKTIQRYPFITLITPSKAGAQQRNPILLPQAKTLGVKNNNANRVKIYLRKWRDKFSLKQVAASLEFPEFRTTPGAVDSALAAYRAIFPSAKEYATHNTSSSLLAAGITDQLHQGKTGVPVRIFLNNYPPALPSTESLPNAATQNTSCNCPGNLTNQAEIPLDEAYLSLKITHHPDCWRFYARRAEVRAPIHINNLRAVADYRVATEKSLTCHQGNLLIRDLRRTAPEQQILRQDFPGHFDGIEFALLHQDAELAELVPRFNYTSEIKTKMINLFVEDSKPAFFKEVALYLLESTPVGAKLEISYTVAGTSVSDIVLVPPRGALHHNYVIRGKKYHLELFNEGIPNNHYATIHLSRKKGFYPAEVQQVRVSYRASAKSNTTL